MSFVPELVSTTRFSNRDRPAVPSDGPPATSKPRFLPEPVETTRRTNRAVPDSTSSSTSATPKASPVKGKESASRFVPEPVETTRRSNRTQPVSSSPKDPNRKGWGRDSCDEIEESQTPNQNQAALQRRIPVPIPGPGKSKWFPADEASQWGRPLTQPVNYDARTSPLRGNASFQPARPEQAISSQVRDSGHPRRSQPANEHAPIAAFDACPSNRANPHSKDPSPASSLDSNGPNYLLDSPPERKTEGKTAVPTITSSEYFSPPPAVGASSHALPEPPASLASTGVKRPLSPNTILVRDFGYDSGRPTFLKLPKPDASACSVPGVVPKLVPPAQRNGHSTNINTPSPPSQTGLARSLDPSTINITNSSSQEQHTAAGILRDQVLAAQSQLIREKQQQALLSPTYTPKQHPQPPNNNNNKPTPSAGSDEPKRKKPLLPFSFLPAAPRSVISGTSTPGSPYLRVLLTPGAPVTPLLCESPMPTTLFYESSKMPSHGSGNSSHGDYFSAKKQASNISLSSNADSVVSRDTALTTPSTRPSSPNNGHKYGYTSTSTSSLVAMVCATPQPIESDPPNMCPQSKRDVSTEFVVAVYNYLSLNHESVARKFDRELCEGTGWSLQRVTTDRLGALREYVEEYIERRPRFGSGMGGW